jgi:hypothetical protein
MSLLSLFVYGTREAPLVLTDAIVPEREDWRRANRLFDHVRGCRCSTCKLAADLGRVVRGQREAR